MPDVVAGTFRGMFLKIFSDCVEEHHGYGFGIFANGKGSDGGYGHKGELIEIISLPPPAPRFGQHRQADRQKGDEKPKYPQPAVPMRYAPSV